MAEYYLLFKALHIISFISWLAGMLYLPRLYVYHTAADSGSEMDKTFQIMERRLLRYIINPAMIATFIFGGILAYISDAFAQGNGWMHIKLVLVLILAGFHGMCARWRKAFIRGENRHSAKFYRIANEVPTLLMVAIVLLAVMKPF